MSNKTVALNLALFSLVLGKQTGFLPYQNNYGDDYNKKWIFFPNGDNIPFYVDLIEPLTSKQLTHDEVATELEFRLYTRNNPNDYILLDQNANTINGTDLFVRGAPVKIVTHGWMSSADKNSVMNIKREYLKNFNYNVIGVDWSDVANFVMYPTVALRTKAVGQAVGNFIDSLGAKYGVTGDQLHLIGHSLGAHVMGNAASATKLRMGRITGLDPARPMFEVPAVPHYLRLDPSDAGLVDVIHTCAAVLGVDSPVGHMDFYPNSGLPPQPGCVGVQAVFEACSHSRAHFLFSESINNPRGFPSQRCETWHDYTANTCDKEPVFMGDGLVINKYGKYYLQTNPIQPYARFYG